jgi:hypothetical protein
MHLVLRQLPSGAQGGGSGPVLWSDSPEGYPGNAGAGGANPLVKHGARRRRCRGNHLPING